MRQRLNLGVRPNQRADARELFGDKPDLKLIESEDVANQQVIGAIVAAHRCGMCRLTAFVDDEFVSLQQTEQLNRGAGVLNGCVKPGDTIAIVGGGPVGLAARPPFHRPQDFQPDLRAWHLIDSWTRIAP